MGAALSPRKVDYLLCEFRCLTFEFSDSNFLQYFCCFSWDTWWKILSVSRLHKSLLDCVCWLLVSSKLFAPFLWCILVLEIWNSLHPESLQKGVLSSACWQWHEAFVWLKGLADVFSTVINCFISYIFCYNLCST